jgi:hypothetical protein
MTTETDTTVDQLADIARHWLRTALREPDNKAAAQLAFLYCGAWKVAAGLHDHINLDAAALQAGAAFSSDDYYPARFQKSARRWAERFGIGIVQCLRWEGCDALYVSNGHVDEPWPTLIYLMAVEEAGAAGWSVARGDGETVLRCYCPDHKHEKDETP